MRTNNAIRNGITAILSHIVSLIFGFFVQAFFVKKLGTEYLGLNGLFSNIFSMLSIVELGIGSAIVFNLYKPIAENDYEKIKSLMKFYKRCYYGIALIILILSIILMPFINIIVGKIIIDTNTIYLVYILFIIDTICSYIMSYNRSMLYASQQNYIIDIVHVAYLFIVNSLEILLLLCTNNYILFLIIKIVMKLLENIVLTIIVNHKYQYINGKSKELNNSIVKDIKKKVKGLFMHKIGTFLVGGTDNIIISTFLGVSTVGLYSNYFLIINALSTLINQLFSSLKSSIGNLLVEKNEVKNYLVFEKIQFLNFWFAMMSSAGIYIIMENFITFWLGKEYLLSNFVLITLSINNYLYITKLGVGNFKEATGIFYEDRYVALLEAIINIVASIIFVKFLGLGGVFLGTIVSSLLTHLYTFPHIVYKRIFNKEYIDYFKDNSKYFVFTILVAIVLKLISNYIDTIFYANFIRLTIKLLLVLFLPTFLISIIYKKNEVYIYYYNFIKNKIKKVLKGKKK